MFFEFTVKQILKHKMSKTALLLAIGLFYWFKFIDGAISKNVNDLRYIFVPSDGSPVEMDFNHHPSLEDANINPNLPLVVTIDGFLSNTTSPMTTLLRNAYPPRKRENLIILDWSQMSGSRARVDNFLRMAAAYLTVLGNVRPIGERLANFLELLGEVKGISLKNVHIIGGSMGAHIAGATGTYLRKKYGSPKIGRISGLDPAGPLFNMQLDKDKKLYRGDALFVDIYHSNRGGLGDMEQDTGDINVYLNGGNNQPGCAEADKENSGTCSHGYSFKTFAYSVDNVVKACPCSGVSCTCNKNCDDDCAYPIQVGPDTPLTARGRYHVSLGPL